jgi:hypothetical protein
MRAMAGPVMLLMVVLAFTGYRYLHKPDAPAREFTDLELSIPGQDGSCYALSTVLVANGIFGGAPRTWKMVGDDEYQLTVERVIQGYGGPAREFSTWTFEKRGKAVELTAVEASQGQPQDPAASIGQLLQAPNARHSTPVERCLEPGASGYLFTRK